MPALNRIVIRVEFFLGALKRSCPRMNPRASTQRLCTGPPRTAESNPHQPSHGSPVHLLVERKAGTAVLLPARLIGLGAKLLFLAIAHRADAVRAYPAVHQRLLGRIGTVLS